jgi:ribose-phosphate pyrophosphokinase
MQIIGDVDARPAVIVDDMVDTAGTLCAAAEAVRNAGAPIVLACATHAVLSGKAVERIEASSLEELVVTDTIPLHESSRACKKIRVGSVAGLLAEAIRRTHNEDSISSLFV